MPERFLVRHHRQIYRSVLLAVVLAGCGENRLHPPQPTNSMLPPDDPGAGLASHFASPYYNADQDPQSPKPPSPLWWGVMIEAQAENVLSLRQPMLLLHGAYRIQGSNYPAKDHIKIIAVDVATKREYTAIAGQRDASPDVPPPPSDPPDPETVKRMVFSGFFNTDLVGTLRLPLVSAIYRVRVEFGIIPSNEINVRVIVR